MNNKKVVASLSIKYIPVVCSSKCFMVEARGVGERKHKRCKIKNGANVESDWIWVVEASQSPPGLDGLSKIILYREDREH